MLAMQMQQRLLSRAWLRRAPAALFWAAASTATAVAQQLPAQLLACTRETDDVRRLACFDREIAGAPKPAAPADTERYGLPRSSDDRAAVLEARVTAVTERAQGQLVIELDNSQVWLQTDLDARLGVRPGVLVRIRPGVLGSFFLKPESGSGARVKRLR
jgi:hypothetical protein